MALRDIVRLLVEDLNTEVLDEFAAERQRRTSAPRLSGGRGFPVVRLNALQVTQAPAVCRRVVCSVGGYAELAGAVREADVDLLYARVTAGVLAFGADADVRAALESYGIEEFDLHTIDQRRLRYDSGERGLLRDAVARAVARRYLLMRERRRSTDLLWPADPRDTSWLPLRGLVGGSRARCPVILSCFGMKESVLGWTGPMTSCGCYSSHAPSSMVPMTKTGRRPTTSRASAPCAGTTANLTTYSPFGAG